MAVEFLSDYNEHRATFGETPIGYTIVLISCIAVIGIPFILWWHFAVRFERLWIENNNIIHERGLLTKDRVEIQIRTIRSVRLSQTFLQRFTGVGTLFITSSGSAPEIVAPGMPRARALRVLLMGHPNPV